MDVFEQINQEDSNNWDFKVKCKGKYIFINITTLAIESAYFGALKKNFLESASREVDLSTFDYEHLETFFRCHYNPDQGQLICLELKPAELITLINLASYFNHERIIKYSISAVFTERNCDLERKEAIGLFEAAYLTNKKYTLLQMKGADTDCIKELYLQHGTIAFEMNVPNKFELSIAINMVSTLNKLVKFKGQFDLNYLSVVRRAMLFHDFITSEKYSVSVTRNTEGISDDWTCDGCEKKVNKLTYAFEFVTIPGNPSNNALYLCHICIASVFEDRYEELFC